ncbi:hypothetical protein CR513_44904, partial [Mucuna pruriens]
MKAMMVTPPILTRPTLGQTYPSSRSCKKSNLARRMVGWTIQLFEFDISFERRGHIKAQALVDFITKLAPVGYNSSNGREWFQFVDGALNQWRSEVGIILEGPNGVLIEQSL